MPLNGAIPVPIRSDPVLDPSGSQQRLDAVQIIRDEALSNGLFSLEQILPNGRPDLGYSLIAGQFPFLSHSSAFHVENAFRCPSGFVLINDGTQFRPQQPGANLNTGP